VRMMGNAPGVVRGEHEGMDENSNQRVHWTVRRKGIVSRLGRTALDGTNRNPRSN
jgi:hypothetical protein